MVDALKQEQAKQGITLLRSLAAAADYVSESMERQDAVEKEIEALEMRRDSLKADVKEEESRLDKTQKAGEASKKSWDEVVDKLKDKVNAITTRAQEEANQIIIDAQIRNTQLNNENAQKLADIRKLDAEIASKKESLGSIEGQIKKVSSNLRSALNNVAG